MSQNILQNKQIIKSFEKQLNIFLNESKEEEITNIVLSNFFDKVINNLKHEKLISDTLLEVYQGKAVIAKPLHTDYPRSPKQTCDENWQKFYSFNRDIMIENTIGFIAKNLKKASIKDKLYYSFAKLSEQLDLKAISDHFMNKINNYITFNDL
ncbi:hypothetical protein [Rickettsia endosymbiont of Pantilius tunicatus]|uniref:hypothetical protein n=1 Tax=unclassified Rickettsia TaxID=114295 RepID=UPI0030E078C6